MTAPEPDLVRLEGVHRHYALPRDSLWRPPERLRAVDGVDLGVRRGRNFGLIGESGSGKSTLARLVMALEPPSAGRVLFEGDDLNTLAREALRQRRRDFQMVFQDPFGSLDPRLPVERIVAEPLAALHDADRAERRARVAEVVEAVGLRSGDLGKYPHEFSGGQRQRIAIARALVTHPKLIVADEPVSALDVSVRAQVLNLFKDLQDRFDVTYFFISHDLAVIEQICDEVAVMQTGRIVEQGPTEEVFANPQHGYTRALFAAVPLIPQVG